MRGGGALESPLRAGFISADAAIHHHTLTLEREFVTQHVAVAVTRLIVRSQASAIKDDRAFRFLAADNAVSCLRKYDGAGRTFGRFWSLADLPDQAIERVSARRPALNR